MAEAAKAAEATRRDRALTVACPLCEVGAGARCVNTVTGQPSNLVHMTRVRAWKQERGNGR